MARNRDRILSIAGSAFAILLYWMSMYMYVPILPTHARSVGATEAQIGSILAAYGLTQLMFRLPLGLLSDRWGRKKVFALLGTLLVTASGAGLALARTPTGLFLFRALSGCAATAWVTISVLYNSQFSIEHAVRTAGQLNLLGAVGQIVAMSAGGLIAQRWGAAAAFGSSAILSVPALLAFALVKERPTDSQSRITGRQFVRAISTPRLLLVSGLAACSQYAMFGAALGFAAVRAQDLGASDAQLGILTTAVQVAKALPMLILSLGRRRQNGRLATILGLALVAAPLFVFPFLTRFPLLVICQAVFGLGIGFAFPTLMGMALQAVEPEARASAMGVFQSVYALGMTLGPAVSGVVADRWGIVGVYLSTGGLMVVATLGAVWLLREHAHRPTSELAKASKKDDART